jgi:excisionase family DNA binding protein
MSTLDATIEPTNATTVAQWEDCMSGEKREYKDTDLLTTTEAAEVLDLTPERIRQYIRAGRLPYVKEGEGFRATYKIKYSDLMELKSKIAPPGRPPELE